MRGCASDSRANSIYAKFPPPIEFSVRPGETWDGSDYMGCSLQSWCNLFGPHGYRLVACNITGANAFFVRSDLSNFFQDVPDNVSDLFMPCDYNWFVQSGHETSPRTVASFLKRATTRGGANTRPKMASSSPRK
jgi:hypothetical protein